MFCADFVERASDSALEDAPKDSDRLRVNRANNSRKPQDKMNALKRTALSFPEPEQMRPQRISQSNRSAIAPIPIRPAKKH
jgi:hypothetical protein